MGKKPSTMEATRKGAPRRKQALPDPELPHLTFQGQLMTMSLPGGDALYFSRQVLIGFTWRGVTVTRQNDWGETAGEHLAAVDGGGPAVARRLPTGEFIRAYREAFPVRRPRLPRA